MCYCLKKYRVRTITQPARKYGHSGKSIVENGRDGVIRTLDPHNPIVVRYQAALRPDD